MKYNCNKTLDYFHDMASHIRSRRHKVKVTTYKDEISSRGSELMMGYEKKYGICAMTA